MADVPPATSSNTNVDGKIVSLLEVVTPLSEVHHILAFVSPLRANSIMPNPAELEPAEKRTCTFSLFVALFGV